jgi:undecaprenyl-diphosphatase
MSLPPARARLLSKRAALGIVLWLAAAALFVFLGFMAAFYDRFPADERIAHEVQAIDVAALGGFFHVENALGSALVYISMTIALAVAFAARGLGGEALLVLATFAPRVANGFVKDWIERPRPSPELVDVSGSFQGWAFPSGHTVGTFALFGSLVFLIPALVPSRPLRWLLQAGCLMLALAAGPARVYVGAHWPSDTLGGYLLAALALSPLVALYLAIRGNPDSRRGGAAARLRPAADTETGRSV